MILYVYITYVYNNIQYFLHYTYVHYVFLITSVNLFHLKWQTNMDFKEESLREKIHGALLRHPRTQHGAEEIHQEEVILKMFSWRIHRLVTGNHHCDWT